jgi:hypothetical protein
MAAAQCPPSVETQRWATRMVNRLKMSAYFGAQARLWWDAGDKDLSMQLEDMSYRIQRGDLDK